VSFSYFQNGRQDVSDDIIILVLLLDVDDVSISAASAVHIATLAYYDVDLFLFVHLFIHFLLFAAL